MKILALFAIVLSLGLTACEQGPMESMGESIDNTATDLGNAVEDACEDVTNAAC